MTLELLAPAKINLTLEVLGRREDGYHEVATLMHAIDLADRVRIQPDRGLVLELGGDALAGVPREGPANLAFRAASALMEAAGAVTLGARLVLEKSVPSGTGLGGGSSDAAAVLRGLNQFWQLGLEIEDLRGIAQGIGSDVAFFLSGGAAECRGRGEIVHPLEDAVARPLTLFLSDFAIPDKTRKMFSYLTPADYSLGRETRVACNTFRRGIPLGGTDLVNVFDRYIAVAAPPAGKAMALCRQAGLDVHAAGCGPSFYSLSPLADVPGLLRRTLASMGIRCVAATTLTRAECLSVKST
jgi:4-diphosphocytidyl-2-C-methyl-D-erythritol kinase